MSKGAPHETIFQISRALNGTEISRGNDLPNIVKHNSQVLLKRPMKLSAGKVTPNVNHSLLGSREKSALVTI